MGISATTAGYTNTGHDIHMTLVQADGSTINVENVMQFDARQETQDITRVRLDNRVLVADLPKLWTGTITYDRGTGVADKAIAAIEDSWFSGQDYRLGSMVINITASAPGSGSATAASSVTTAAAVGGVNTEIRFVDVSLKQSDSGQWRGDDATSCRLEFRAARRIVGGVGTLTSVLNQDI